MLNSVEGLKLRPSLFPCPDKSFPCPVERCPLLAERARLAVSDQCIEKSRIRPHEHCRKRPHNGSHPAQEHLSLLGSPGCPDEVNPLPSVNPFNQLTLVMYPAGSNGGAPPRQFIACRIHRRHRLLALRSLSDRLPALTPARVSCPSYRNACFPTVLLSGRPSRRLMSMNRRPR